MFLNYHARLTGMLASKDIYNDPNLFDAYKRNCLPNKKVQCIQMQPFEHEAYNIVYLGLRVVSNDVTHIKGTLQSRCTCSVIAQ
jgi:hypothetical protein